MSKIVHSRGIHPVPSIGNVSRTGPVHAEPPDPTWDDPPVPMDAEVVAAPPVPLCAPPPLRGPPGPPPPALGPPDDSPPVLPPESPLFSEQAASAHTISHIGTKRGFLSMAE